MIKLSMLSGLFTVAACIFVVVAVFMNLGWVVGCLAAVLVADFLTTRIALARLARSIEAIEIRSMFSK